MSVFQTYRERFAKVEGWFDEDAQAIWDVLLNWQTQIDLHGNLGEIGVYRGKSAFLSTLHAREDEHCLFIDPVLSQPLCNELKKAHPGSDDKSVFLKSISDPLDNPQFISKWNKSFRWFHIDGEHSGMAVTHDLKIADALLHRQGLLCLDDFLSPRYPQVSQSVFRYLEKKPESFCLILCGYNKGYLCRPYLAPILRRYIFDNMHKEMESRTGRKYTIWRSTMPDDLNCFGITEREHDTPFRGPDWMPDKIIF